MSLLEEQIKAIKEIYSELDKAKSNIKPIIMGKFALTVYTQGMYPASNISLLFPDIELLRKVLKELGYQHIGNDYWLRGDVAVEINKNFELIVNGKFNQIEVDNRIINVISLEDLLADMMNQCLEGDDTVCDLIKLLINSYYEMIDFHYLYTGLKNKKAVIKFNEIKKEVEM
ncbi:MAG: 6-carboxyhexanoate--CoA ligase [Persephonella sp.]|nr:MAG: 6-carboxyhexanoate--CoA ligase [Persephonella sp.]